MSKIDVRGLSPLLIEHKFIQLPNEVNEKIIQFMREQNLIFSSLDFICSKNHEYYFIENNCNGQWIWLENVTGVDISSSFIDLLCHNDS